jgi:hypothetical protein
MREILHLDFNPNSVAWIGGLRSRLANSSVPQLRKGYESWASFGLDELALAIATRLAIIRRVEERLRECLTALVYEIDQSAQLETLLTCNCCYQPSAGNLLFDICAAVDSCFFEGRSLYEVLGKLRRLSPGRFLTLRSRNLKF